MKLGSEATNTKVVSSFSLSDAPKEKDIPLEMMKKTRLLLVDILENTTALPFRKMGQSFRCFYCTTNCYFASELRSHYANKHQNENIKLWVKRNVTRRAILVKLDITDLSCKICSKSLTNLQDFAIHIREHDKKIANEQFDNIVCVKLSDYHFKCSYCDKEFSFFPQLYSHIHHEHLKKNSICPTCGLCFADDRSLSSHIRKHVDKKVTFDCTLCNRKFYTEINRSKHIKRTHGNNKCTICGVILRSEFQKENHMAKEHDFYIREFKCDRCPRKFILNKFLVKHIKNQHLKEKNKACDVCGARFFDIAILNQHKITHSDEKPFECSICSKKFARRKTYRQHLRIHADERNYICKECGKAYVHHSGLVWHKKTHDKSKGIDKEAAETLENSVLRT